MKRYLEARRQKILRELAHLDREITANQQRLAEIQMRLAMLTEIKVRLAA
jgi:hypothetical protein